ncbi:hypothetical protein SAMN05421734_10797 [Pelagirhabdus alkalitolerans]|uniref:YviE n=1 Tax=Pelagirhabdus alkalitolerans TaxID=1612202 RepID=A0A1G6L584_9BACI|nr:DUF6470 family protein [Pelagirhabdus alkalitolerans]SDC38283.1 hypothetical protein SAMN05421734_10797 [Pelagirhabdus alkalitolerans]
MLSIPQLRIDSQQARIGLNIDNAVTELNQGPAELSIQQPEADVSIQTRPSRLTIDQSRAFADLNQYPASEAIEREAAKGMQEAEEGSKRRRLEGDQMMRIENQTDVIPQIAKQNEVRPYRPFNIGFIPSHFSVDIDYEPAEVDVHIQKNEPIIHAQPTPTTTDYYPGGVDVYLSQEPYLDISFEPSSQFETSI